MTPPNGAISSGPASRPEGLSVSSGSSAHGQILAIDNSVGVLALFTGLLGEEANRVSTQVYADRDLESTEALAPDLIIRDDRWATEDFSTERAPSPPPARSPCWRAKPPSRAFRRPTIRPGAT